MIERPVIEMTKAQTFPHPQFEWMQIDSPELAWPRNHSWVVCIDCDLTSTYVACDQLLAERLESVTDLEVLRTNVDERVDYRRDTINCEPEGLRVEPPLG